MPPGKLPNNKRVPRSTGRNIRIMTTDDHGNSVWCESNLEFMHIVRTRQRLPGAEIVSQPERIEFQDEDEKRHTYVPDFKITPPGEQSQIHEVGLEMRRSDPRISQREQAARKHYHAADTEYIVSTDRSLPNPTEWANIQVQYSFRAPSSAEPAAVETVIELLTDQSPQALSDLVNAASSISGVPSGRVVSTICHLLWKRKLATSPDTLMFVHGQISRKSKVWIVSGG
ncbi:MAG: hypothetical protein EPO32_10220 [Anaerolineae bacterium]|nr:MAG: hypothetical protein EPO32_10220 [Anaerolineae bacterium]